MTARKLVAIVALGALPAALTAWGSDQPAKAVKGDAGCRCGDKAATAPAPEATAQAATLLARAGQDDEPKAEAKGHHHKKASPESAAKATAIRKSLLDLVKDLDKEGLADCCTGPPCVMCVIAADGCGCGASLAKGGPVCPECWGGWQAGIGSVKDVKKEDVKGLPPDVLKKLYDAKAKKLGEASK